MASDALDPIRRQISDAIAEIHKRAARLSPLDIYNRMDAIREVAAANGLKALEGLAQCSAQLALMPGHRIATASCLEHMDEALESERPPEVRHGNTRDDPQNTWVVLRGNPQDGVVALTRRQRSRDGQVGCGHGTLPGSRAFPHRRDAGNRRVGAMRLDVGVGGPNRPGTLDHGLAAGFDGP